MDIRKLLIADGSAAFCGALTDMLGGAYETRICCDGIQTRALLEEFRPDVLVLDLTLPGLDGIAVLRELAGRSQRPAILVTTRLLSPYIQHAVEALDVDYLVVKPCDIRALADRIHDLAQEPLAPQILTSPELSASNMLLDLDISIKRRGFRCLETAVVLFSQNPGQSMTKELYPAVARQCGGNGEAVERAIRGAVHAAWERRDEAAWRRYFRPCRGGMVPRPTNTAFIAALAECLRRQTRDSAAG